MCEYSSNRRWNENTCAAMYNASFDHIISYINIKVPIYNNVIFLYKIQIHVDSMVYITYTGLFMLLIFKKSGKHFFFNR